MLCPFRRTREVNLRPQDSNQRIPDRIIFFDGNCPMCHSWVKRIIRWDRNKLFRFVPLESDLSLKILTPLLPEFLKENTIIYFQKGKTYIRSDAILEIIKIMNFPINIFYAGKVIPKSFRDKLYTWVAAKRYKFGARYSSCPIPPREWTDRFLS